MKNKTMQYIEEARNRNIVTFKEFLAALHIGDDAEVVPLLRECWNRAVQATARAHGCTSSTSRKITSMLLSK
ncbi:MAG: hypothetical protein WC459_04175 [Patescibacteria group bacterium]